MQRIVLIILMVMVGRLRGNKMKAFIFINLIKCAAMGGNFKTQTIKQFKDPGIMNITCISDDNKPNHFYCLFKLKDGDTFHDTNSKYADGGYDLIKGPKKNLGLFLLPSKGSSDIFHLKGNIVLYQSRSIGSNSDLQQTCMGYWNLKEK